MTSSKTLKLFSPNFTILVFVTCASFDFSFQSVNATIGSGNNNKIKYSSPSVDSKSDTFLDIAGAVSTEDAEYTSIKKPPISSKYLNSNFGLDDTGITFPPKLPSTGKKPKINGIVYRLQNLNILGKSFNQVVNFLKKFDNILRPCPLHLELRPSALARLRSALVGRATGAKCNSGFGVREGRSSSRWEGFMDSAMVPLTMVLMTAFILDILQRLFPLPYATMLHETTHGIKADDPAALNLDLDTYQLSSPIDNGAISDNSDIGFDNIQPTNGIDNNIGSLRGTNENGGSWNVANALQQLQPNAITDSNTKDQEQDWFANYLKTVMNNNSTSNTPQTNQVQSQMPLQNQLQNQNQNQLQNQPQTQIPSPIQAQIQTQNQLENTNNNNNGGSTETTTTDPATKEQVNFILNLLKNEIEASTALQSRQDSVEVAEPETADVAADLDPVNNINYADENNNEHIINYLDHLARVEGGDENNPWR